MSEPEISKDLLYGQYQKVRDAQQRLAMSAAHKALDMSEDMNVTSNKTVNGLGAKAIIGILLAAGIPAGIVGGAYLARPSEAKLHEVPGVVAPSAPAERTAYDAVYEQQNPDGSWKEVKRERLK
jgi:hypothetical protein